jgi:PAS domain S-box-containing protein
MPLSEPRSVSRPPDIFDIKTMVELSERGVLDRVAFAAIYAVCALFVLPWPVVAGWIATVIVWEVALGPALDRAAVRMSGPLGPVFFLICYVVAAVLYQAVAFLCLVNGSAIGAMIAATWICGSVLNAFVYSSTSPRLLLAALLPVAVSSVVGPFMAYGLSWKAALVPVLLGLASIASRRFSIDRGAVLGQLADRQSAFADIERKLSIVVEASGDGVFELDLLDDHIQASPNWLAMLGYQPHVDEPAELRWRAFVHPDQIEQVTEDFRAHIRGETAYASTEMRLRCKDGSYKWVLARGRLASRTDDGRPWRIVGTTIDLSVRKALEQQLGDARDTAEAANRAKSEFLANMSHEIRTPLNGVMGVAGALRRTPLNTRQTEMVQVIEESAESLQVLLTDILDLARVEAGRLEISAEPFDLHDAVVTIASLFRAKAEEKGLHLVVDIAPDLDRALVGDKARLKQILGNLLSNAVKFTAHGQVSMAVLTEPLADGRRIVRIKVADTGIGFDETARARLFGRFVQADGSITRRFGGTGLGLSISGVLAELLGGAITVESVVGEGSIFELSLPMALDTAPGEAEAEPERDVFEAGPPLRILAAEDHAVNRKVLALMFESLPVELTIVENGLEAVNCFATDRFDLVLMDMQMPVMDGLQAIAQMRAREQDKGLDRTPIIMLTANALPEHEAAGRGAGADAFVTKPISPQTLLAAIEDTLAAVAEARAA